MSVEIKSCMEWYLEISYKQMAYRSSLILEPNPVLSVFPSKLDHDSLRMNTFPSSLQLLYSFTHAESKFIWKSWVTDDTRRCLKPSYCLPCLRCFLASMCLCRIQRLFQSWKWCCCYFIVLSFSCSAVAKRGECAVHFGKKKLRPSI